MKIRKSSLDELMEKCGIKTQIELAELCNMHPVSLNRLIKGKRRNISGSTMNKLCSVLRAQPGDFLYYEEEENVKAQ